VALVQRPRAFASGHFDLDTTHIVPTLGRPHLQRHAAVGVKIGVRSETVSHDLSAARRPVGRPLTAGLANQVPMTPSCEAGLAQSPGLQRNRCSTSGIGNCRFALNYDARRTPHRTTFEEATTVFADPLSITIPDPLHSLPGDERFVTIGVSNRGRVLVVIRSDGEERIRLIGSRRATRREQAQYEEES